MRTGLLHDDPRQSAPEAIRYDRAVNVCAGAGFPPELVKQGFERVVACGEWACADVHGAQGVGAGYRRIVAEWPPARPDRTLESDPHLKRFRSAPENPQHTPMLTVCLRVRHSSEASRPGMTALA